MVSTVWSVSCLLFFYSRCPRVQPFVKVGARSPRAIWSRCRCLHSAVAVKLITVSIEKKNQQTFCMRCNEARTVYKSSKQQRLYRDFYVTTTRSNAQFRSELVSMDDIISYQILYYCAPKVDRGQLCLPHIGITKTEQNTTKI